MTYNLDGSFVYEAAAEMKKLADQKMAPLLASSPSPGDATEQLTFEMLRQLNDDVAKLTPVQLCRFVGLMQEVCRRAVKDTAEDMEIDLDALDMPAFLTLDKYVSECVGRRKGRHG